MSDESDYLRQVAAPLSESLASIRLLRPCANESFDEAATLAEIATWTHSAIFGI